MASAAGSHSKEGAKRFAQEVGEAWKESGGHDKGLTPDYFIKDDGIFYGYQRYGVQAGNTKNLIHKGMHYHFFFDRHTGHPMIQLTCAIDKSNKGKDTYSDRRDFVRTAMTPEQWAEYFRKGLKSCWEKSKSSGEATASLQPDSSPSRRASSPSPSRRASSPSPSHGRAAMTPKKTPKIPCKFHAKGKCTKGDACPFAHCTPRGGRSYRRRKSKRTQKLRYRKNKGLTIKRRVNRTYHKS
jgi:hypothetical protein